MTVLAFALFDTAVGRCGIAWSDNSDIVRFQLPERNDAATWSRLTGTSTVQEDAMPDRIAAIADGVCAHLNGKLDDLRWVPLDLTGIPEFDRAVYGVARSIAPGSTLTYGQVAAEIEAPGAAQAVGQALGRNPIPILIPCHRVLAADGRIGGFSAYGATVTKRRLLGIEAVPGFSDPALF